ncbi:MAG: hypothetical protein ACOCWT_05670, partial [Desulfohalobiaceae bacterium]
MSVPDQRHATPSARENGGGPGCSTPCTPTDAAPPGEVYLCQVGERVSCGACCGLYNVLDRTRAGLTSLLARRTDAFAHSPRTVEGVLAFKEWVAGTEVQERPLPGFHHCPFIGLVGVEESRAGCLLHPLARGNQGRDLRGMSHWGGAACRFYFCPSSHTIAPRHKLLLRQLITDWYEYGMIVTEHRLLRACFQRLETTLGRRLTPEAVLSSKQAASACRTLVRLKLHWPFRDGGAPAGCHDFFADRPRPPLDCARLGVPAMEHATILAELETRCDSPKELRRAEAYLEQCFKRVLRAMPQPPNSSESNR